MERTHKVLERVRAEFVEMPGMRLTAQQVQRLCGIEPELTATVLAALVAAKFLFVTPDGKYARSTDIGPSRLRPAKAHLERQPHWRTHERHSGARSRR